ncbi:Crp/Fnr family transcriptional regulator [uncultured Polaribacter sp.]|uniref:Crp/Fnr family transcriptional regulator n=1 Tax=uncultured Polaribacter sp. TaxID=174711 RepID=UPI0026376606|nr:Crp/Fnr family transcriptional regulator [uncultured Polaribacter sp.]
MDTFFEQNTSFFLDNPKLAEDFQKIVSVTKFPKHFIIHESGKVCDDLYIITSGIARVFYYREDKNITCHFAAEQESITAIDSFIQRKKSKYYIEALEDLEVLKISHSDLEKLFTSSPKFEHFGRLFLQQIYIDLVERLDDLQLKTAKERYETLLEKKPYLFQRVASKHIASYLNITPETLSRIRGK